jgi:hypothetical protein
VAEVAVQRVRRVLQLRHRALQHLDDRHQSCVVLGDGLQQVDRVLGAMLGGGFALAQGVECTAGSVDERLAVRQALVLGAELGPFVLCGRELVELGDLPGQPFPLALDLVAAFPRAFQGVDRSLALGKGGGQGAGVDAGLAVQELAGRRRAREALPGMLPVDVEQRVGQFAQLRHGGRAAVDPGAALALRIDGSAQQQRVVGLEAGFVEPGLQGRDGVELGADLGARRALAHDAGVAPAAERQLQRIDQDRLACAGLAGQHREAGLEIDFEAADDHEVPQHQPPQH